MNVLQLWNVAWMPLSTGGVQHNPLPKSKQLALSAVLPTGMSDLVDYDAEDSLQERCNGLALLSMGSVVASAR